MPFPFAVQRPRFLFSGGRERLPHSEGQTALPVDADGCKPHILCDACQNVFRSSRLIQGSWILVVLKIETHKLHKSLRQLKASVEARCHFCTLVWQSLFKERGGSTPSEEQTLCQEDNTVLLKLAKKQFWLEMYVECAGFEGRQTWQNRIHVSSDDGEGLTQMTDGSLNRVHSASKFPSTSSAQHAQLARYWLKECSLKHIRCEGSIRDFLPTRLVQMNSDDYSTVRLHVTNSEDTGVTYCTLSHCWGGVEDIPLLTSKTIAVWQTSISVADLPRTFRDAIQITRSLGLNYLWIDSLCILQDSKDDWAKEAASMGSIYENSTCTIAAAAAANAHQGCFVQRDFLKYYPCLIAGSVKDGLFAHPANLPKGTLFELRYSRLKFRGWILQESLLSPRILFFTEYGIFWSCLQGDAAERNQDGKASQKHTSGPIYKHKEDRIFGSSVTTLNWVTELTSARDVRLLAFIRFEEPDVYRSKVQFGKSWYDIIAKYSECLLTKPSDKLIALSAIADRVRQNSGFMYLAGLWRETFIFDLMWRVKLFCAEPRPSVYRAPTWSWASVDGKIESFYQQLRETHHEPLVRVPSIHVSAHPADVHRTGQIRDGCITIVGKLKKVSSIREVRDKERPVMSRIEIREGNPWIGNLYPDITLSEAQMSSMYLLPLIRLYSLGQNNEPIREDWDGIVLFASPNGGEIYNRVGYFRLHSPKLISPHLFDECRDQNVSIK